MFRGTGLRIVVLGHKIRIDATMKLTFKPIHFLLSALMVSSKYAAGSTSSYPVTDASQSQCYDTVTTQTIDCSLARPGQDASYDNMVAQEFCDNQDDTVTDMKTGLMWTKKLYGKMPISQALQPFSLAGYTDWRPPKMKELYTLINFDGVTGMSESTNIPYQNPVFETQYGETRFIDGQIWSVDEYVATVMGDQTCNFGLNPIDGRIKCYGTMDPRTGSESELFVRYVRGSTSIGVNSFTADADIVTDAATGLQWMKNDSGFDNSGEGFDWAGALDYCESLTLGGRSDWRLPDAHELHSIVDYSRSPDTTGSPAVDPIFASTAIINEGGQTDFGWYWTSDTHLDGNEGAAVYVCFGRCLGNFSATPDSSATIIDVHGAGAQRSDPKIKTDQTPSYRGPQGDILRVNNLARCVRGISSAAADIPECGGTDAPEDGGTDAPEDGGTDVPEDKGTDVPEDEEDSEAGNEGNGGCFSGISTVELQDRRIVPMDSLQIGDIVRVGTDNAGMPRFSQVYSFAHLNRELPTEFLQIQTTSVSKPIEMTSNHMLYMYRRENGFQRVNLLPASQVKAGDFLLTAPDLLAGRVQSVRKVERRGVYAPLTVSGSLVVNGIVVSNYVVLPSSVQVFLSSEQQHWVTHIALAPYRTYCTVLGCEAETFNNAGIPKAIALWLPLLHWLALQQSSSEKTLFVAAFVGIMLIWSKKRGTNKDKTNKKMA